MFNTDYDENVDDDDELDDDNDDFSPPSWSP